MRLPSRPCFCSLPDSDGGGSLTHLFAQLQRTAEAKRVQLAVPVDEAALLCVRNNAGLSPAVVAAAAGGDANPAERFAVAFDADVAALQDGDQLHVFAPAPADVAAAIAALPALSSTFALRPPSPQAQRLAEFDRCDTNCTVPRASIAEAAVSTTAIASAAASSDDAMRRSFGAQLLASFRERGFLRLRFSAEELAALHKLAQVQQDFFALPLEQKDPSLIVGPDGLKTSPHKGNYQKAHGYSSSHACRKEFFVVRQPPQPNVAVAAASGAAAAASARARLFDPSLWLLPAEPAEFSAAVFAVFHQMGRVCQHVTSLLLEALGAAPERAAMLLRDSMAPARNDEANRFTSVIELFHYSAGRERVDSKEDSAASASPPPPPPLPCSIHSDASLLTLIPRCVGPAGLHVFNWAAAGWQVAEAQSSADEGILFPGDMMQRVTNGAVLATMHRVAFEEEAARSPSAQSRYSCPFELFLAPEAVVDCATLLGLPPAEVHAECRAVVSAMEALAALSQNLVSVNKTN